MGNWLNEGNASKNKQGIKYSKTKGDKLVYWSGLFWEIESFYIVLY